MISLNAATVAQVPWANLNMFPSGPNTWRRRRKTTSSVSYEKSEIAGSADRFFLVDVAGSAGRHPLAEITGLAGRSSMVLLSPELVGSRFMAKKPASNADAFASPSFSRRPPATSSEVAAPVSTALSPNFCRRAVSSRFSKLKRRPG